MSVTSQTSNIKIPSIVFKPVSGTQAPKLSQKIEKVNWNLGDQPPKPKSYQLNSQANKSKELISTDQYNGGTCAKDGKCTDPTLVKSFGAATWTWIIVIPLIVFILLIFLAPTFVEADNDENQPTNLNYGMIVLWTIIISIILWVSLFAFNNCCSIKE